MINKKRQAYEQLKVTGKDGKTDITDKIKPDLLKSWEEQIDRLNEQTYNRLKHESEKEIQPFKTNHLLEDLVKSQTPLWVNYTILIITAVSLIVGIWALLHSYLIV